MDAAALIKEMEQEFPAFRIVYKRQSAFSALLDRLLRLITLGGQDRFLTEYYTVIGETLYVPDSWDTLPDVDRRILLRHERVHLRQKRRYTFLGMAFLYLIPWFPLGLAYGRARLEWEAYAETLLATAELKGLEAAQSHALRDHIVGRFIGPDYGWMWPFRSAVERWWRATLQDIERLHPTASDRARSASANQPE
ncbi:MAG: hypothetical protein RJA70_831 [Pseudomonadota bacterium]|jgi:hypothetical protein